MVRSGGIRGFETLVRSLGGDPLPLLRRHRITLQSLKDEDALIPIRAAAQLMEDAATTLDCPDFGLRLSRPWDVTILGPLAVAMQHSSTIADALQCATRYLFVHSPAIGVHVTPRSKLDPKSAEVRIELLAPGVSALRQVTDSCLGGLHRIMQLLAREQYRPQAVCVPHAPLAPVSAYRRHFGVPVRVSQPYAAILVSPGSLEAPLQTVSKTLHRLAADYLDVHFPSPGQTVASRARLAISRSLGTTQISKERVAGMLAMHPRTLQRHLADEGTSYDEIREELSKEAAQRYLTSTQMPLTQVAGLLGMSQQSVLTRACKRWFKATPKLLRRQAAARP